MAAVAIGEQEGGGIEVRGLERANGIDGAGRGHGGESYRLHLGAPR
jgi:hypothetical protein